MDARLGMQRDPAKLVDVLQTRHCGDTALSTAVLQAIGWRWEAFGCPGNGLWYTPRGSTHSGPLPPVTEAAAAARALLPGDVFIAAAQGSSGLWSVELFTHPLVAEVDHRNPVVSASGHTLALALCSATIQLNGSD